MREHVVLVVGAPGAGTTTAINVVSELARTEDPSDDLDYGEIALGPEERLRLYGAPGGKRFDFMWSILRQRAVGLVVLVRNDGPDPVAELEGALEEYRGVRERGAVVIGITHSDDVPSPTPADYERVVAAIAPEAPAPVFTLDPRRRDQLVTMLSVLAANVDSRAMFLGR